jgi:hypothetical protein
MVVNCVMLTGGARIPMLVWYQHLVYFALRRANVGLVVMTGKPKGSPRQYKRFRVKRDARGTAILASFDTLEEAISSVRRRRHDWRYVIFDGRTVVWPESRVKVE